MICIEIHAVVCAQTNTSARPADVVLTGGSDRKKYNRNRKSKNQKKIWNHLHCMGPDIFSTLRMKGDVWSALLTKKVSQYVFVTVEWNLWKLRKNSPSIGIILK